MFTTDLKNAISKDAIGFLILLKNKEYFVTNVTVNTRIEQGITKFQKDSGSTIR